MPSKKLLVADDSLTIQKVIRLALSNEGYEIESVSDGNDALQQISLIRPDAVLIDVSLPGKNAFELKDEVNSHEDLSNVRFILMSSAFEKVDEALAQQVKFDGSLTKPFDPAHLRQVIAQVLEKPVTPPPLPIRSASPPQAPQEMPPDFPSDEIHDEGGPDFLSLQNPPPPLPGSSAKTPPSVPTSAPLEAGPGMSLDLPSFATPTGFPPSSDFDNDFSAPGEFPPPPEFSPSEFDPSANSVGMPAFPSFDMDDSSHAHENTQSFDTNEFVKVSPPGSFPGGTPDFPPMESFLNGEEQDIKQLTESTMKISGMGDFEWSVNEPTLKPMSHMNEFGGAVVPPPPLPTSTPPPASTPKPHTPSARQIPVPSPIQSPPPPLGSSGPFMVDQAQLDKMVRDQVEETLKKMVQKTLPDIAERLIKQEIHRMLLEP